MADINLIQITTLKSTLILSLNLTTSIEIIINKDTSNLECIELFYQGSSKKITTISSEIPISSNQSVHVVDGSQLGILLNTIQQYLSSSNPQGPQD